MDLSSLPEINQQLTAEDIAAVRRTEWYGHLMAVGEESTDVVLDSISREAMQAIFSADVSMGWAQYKLFLDANNDSGRDLFLRTYKAYMMLETGIPWFRGETVISDITNFLLVMKEILNDEKGSRLNRVAFAGHVEKTKDRLSLLSKKRPEWNDQIRQAMDTLDSLRTQPEQGVEGATVSYLVPLAPTNSVPQKQAA
ncbi:hypothetical protein KC640_02255 [Candidatus Dojkabacteria bacterium]|uniref:Uncharacterized protein n=1 Tax=Candidatus Dojkabacteria bacterium TaxID=2099670 RepID=A0A955I7C1_9BACT|nr:hypothetical protein [Candidatus Dojkabacteria bacterium]